MPAVITPAGGSDLSAEDQRRRNAFFIFPVPKHFRNKGSINLLSSSENKKLSSLVFHLIKALSI